MELSKIDLSAIAAVGHSDDQLGLLIDKGGNLEYVEVPAPKAAYYGLQEVAALANSEETHPYISVDGDLEYDYYPEPSTYRLENEYTRDLHTSQVESYDRLIYQYERTVEVTVKESLSIVKTDEYFHDEPHPYYYESDRTEESKQIKVDFSDGSVYQYKSDISQNYHAESEEDSFDESIEYVAKERESFQEFNSNNAQLWAVDYDTESQCLRMEFDDGSVYEYEEVTPKVWHDFQELIS